MFDRLPIQNSRGDVARQRNMGIGDLLLENRIIFMDGVINDAVANVIVMKLLTYCVGLAASGGAILVAGGAKGKRFALKHSKMMIHQPHGEVGGQVSDIEIQAKDILDTKQVLNELLASHTGQPVETIARDTERDRYMTAIEAKEYGLVDDILMKPDADKPAESK